MFSLAHLPFADTPYGQLFSMRFQLPGRHPVVAWPTLSFAGPIVQVLDAGRVDGSFLAIVPTGLMHCTWATAALDVRFAL